MLLTLANQAGLVLPILTPWREGTTLKCLTLNSVQLFWLVYYVLKIKLECLYSGLARPYWLHTPPTAYWITPGFSTHFSELPGPWKHLSWLLVDWHLPDRLWLEDLGFLGVTDTNFQFTMGLFKIKSIAYGISLTGQNLVLMWPKSQCFAFNNES